MKTNKFEKIQAQNNFGSKNFVSKKILLWVQKIFWSKEVWSQQNLVRKAATILFLKRLVIIGSVTVEILLIWTNVARTNVALTNVTVSNGNW